MNAKTKQLLNDYENEIMESWHIALGNRTIPFKVSLTQLALSADRICQSIYIREKGKKPDKDFTFFKMINLFYSDGIFDIQLKTMMDVLRKAAATRRHDITIIEKAFTDKMRLILMDIIFWYQRNYKMQFKDLKINKYRDILYKKPVHMFRELHKAGHLSDTNYEKNMENPKLLIYDVEDKKLMRTPVYASLLIDVSGSMRPHTNEVIKGHKEAIAAIRGSMVCKQGALFLMQHLFNHESLILNPLTKVDKSANDSIVILDQNNYTPQSTTALFDTLYEALNLICIEVNSLKLTEGKKPEIIIAVMTDGMDNESKSHNASDIKNLIQYLNKENVIKSSVLIGWINSQDLDESYLTNLKDNLGFEETIALEQSDSKSIRTAFNLWSNRVV